MLAAQRRARIAQVLEESGAVSVADLVESLDVSDMTVRRDLDALSAQGIATKVHGGAIATSRRSTEEPGFAAKSTQEERHKERIAAEAVRMVDAGMAVGLAAGTTTWSLARRLLTVPDLTIVTNSPQIAGVFYADPPPNSTVVLTGGVRTPSDALVGPLTVQAMKDIHLDVAFLGTHGMSERTGFTTPNMLEAETNRAIIASAAQTVLLADHTKWGLVGISTFAEFSEVSRLISTADLPQDAQRILDEEIENLVLLPAERTLGTQEAI